MPPAKASADTIGEKALTPIGDIFSLKGLVIEHHWNRTTHPHRANLNYKLFLAINFHTLIVVHT